MARRESRWTRVYWGSDDEDKRWYIRLIPDFMDVESCGLGHGLSISGNVFATREEAEKAADFYDKFFDKMAEELIQDYKESQEPKVNGIVIADGYGYTIVNGTKFYHDDDIQ